MELDIDPDWLLEMAEKENGCIVSVGGLVTRIIKGEFPMNDNPLLNIDPNLFPLATDTRNAKAGDMAIVLSDSQLHWVPNDLIKIQTFVAEKQGEYEALGLLIDQLSGVVNGDDPILVQLRSNARIVSAYTDMITGAFQRLLTEKYRVNQ